MTSREWTRRAAAPRARERLGALVGPDPLLSSSLTPRPAEDADDDVPRTRVLDDRSVAADPPAHGDAGDVIAPDVVDHDVAALDVADSEADDVLARLRSSALSVASTAYTAAHGHPLDRPDPLEVAPTRRWALTLRSALVVVITLLVVGGVVLLRAATTSADVVPLTAPADGEAPGDPFGADASVVVHVVGEVAAPGVVELPPGARVAEAVEAAGGATPQAVLGAVNLARVVADGEQIVVPTEQQDGEEGGVVAVPSGPEGDGRIDLNVADATALESLPGVGPVLAGRILEWRAEHGRFSAVAELAEVSGIGPSLLARLSDLVRV